MAAPIMAIDTIIQGVLRLPVKNVELSLLREAKDEIKNNKKGDNYKSEYNKETIDFK